MYFVLEYADIGTIYDLVQICGALNENLARFYFSKLIDAVGFLHNLEIAHRDIKPLNILLKSDAHMLKLADFGHAVNPENRLSIGVMGTHDYRAPEVLNVSGYNPMAADVFSCGVTLFAMVFGFELFFKKKKENGDPYPPMDCYWYKMIWKRKYDAFWENLG